jgi:hypothetical protein
VLVFVFTLLASPVLLGELPLGWNTNAVAMVMHNDRWDAGFALLQAADFLGEQYATFGYNFVRGNHAALTACYELAVKEQKGASCIVTVEAQ